MSDEKAVVVRDRMTLWNAMATPPESALSEITGGRLGGMTDIKPQWRIQIMTEQFGPCGTGWGYEIEKAWTEPGPDGQTFALVLVQVWYKGGEQTTPGVGGAMLVDMEKAGLHCDDDAFKKALTDGIGVALRALGVAADVYLGKAKGGHYTQPSPAQANGSAMLAKLFDVLRHALEDGTLNNNQFADTVKGMDRFLTKHPGKTVDDYTKSVEFKLKKKREEKPIGQPVTIKGKPAEDAEVIDDAKDKAEMLNGIGTMADKAAEQPPDEGLF